MIQRGYPSYNNNISLILRNNKNQYRMRIDEYDAEDVTSTMGDGINYDHCSFHSTIVLSDYIESGEYAIYLELSNSEDKKYLYDTGQRINVD